MAARNVTRGTIVATDVEVAASLISKFMGLMGRQSLPPGHGLWLPDSNGIHMMFMRFAIDAVFYDREGRVTKVARRLRPWIGLASGGRGSRGVVELPAAASRDVEKGQTLVFEG